MVTTVRGDSRPSRLAAALLLTTSLVAAFVVADPVPTPAQAVTVGNNFFDDFSGGSASWQPLSGTWAIEGSEYSQGTASGGEAVSALIDKRFGDAIYDLDLRLIDNGGSSTNTWAGLVFKRMGQSDGPFGSGFTVFVRSNGVVELYKVNATLASVSTGLSMTTTRHLRVVVSGANIQVYLNNEATPRINLNDSTFASGYAALTTFSSHWHFDNVRVTAPELPYRIELGPAELLYADANMPTQMDQSFATIKKDANTFYSYMVNSYDPDLYRWYGPADNPLQTLDFKKTDMTSWIDMNGLDAGYGMYEIWMPNMYKISATELIAFTHNEKYPGSEGRGLPMFTMGIAYSADGGASWEFCGEIIRPGHDRLNIGGSPYIIKDGYFYLYYNEGTRATNDYSAGWPRSLGVARASVSAVVAAARTHTVTPWLKYAGGTFGTNALTGVGDTIIQNTYLDHDAHADASYSTALGKYLLTVQTEYQGKLLLYSSSDGITWSMEHIVDSVAGGYMQPYSSFVDLEGGSDDGSTVDDDFYIQYERKPQGDYDHDDLYRKQVSIVLNTDYRFSASSGYSSTAGLNQWRYEQLSGSTFSAMTWNATTGRWQGSSTYALVASTFQHPDVQDSVRTWVAPSAGLIRVTGTARKADDAGGGDGVRVAIYRNATQIWPASGWNTVGATDFTGVSHDLALTVAVGDLIRFVVDKNSTNTYDTTAWDPTVRYDTFSASSGFSSTQATNGWSYASWDGSTFTPMTWDAANARWKGSTTYVLVGADWQHPDTADSARVWTAPSAGTVLVSGTARMQYGTAGDGVRVAILNNGVPVWPTSGWKSIAYNDTTGISHGISLPVAAGDTIAFVVNRNGTNNSDTTSWNPVVRYTAP
ncbi:MAG: hypothetical protein QM675_05235 [Protaetiibacter sp.]